MANTLVIVVAVRDRAIDAFGRPFFVPTTGAAIRSFQDEMNRHAEDNAMAKHPEDYDLFQLGTWNEETGEFHNDRKQLAVGKDMATQKGA